MAINSTTATIPNYVLMEGNLRASPKVLQLDPSVEYSVIYGFSGKVAYDSFCASCQRAPKPFPLVNGDLRNAINATGDTLQLVAIDAGSPTAFCLSAATIQAVLKARESRADCVVAAYQLTFDKQATAYRVDKQSSVEAEQLVPPSVPSLEIR